MQIGNAITEKMFLDVVLKARDAGLYKRDHRLRRRRALQRRRRDGRKTRAVVWLDRPLKYDGLSYTEIWISEAQERMVLSVPPDNWTAFEAALRPRESKRPSSGGSSKRADCDSSTKTRKLPTSTWPSCTTAAPGDPPGRLRARPRDAFHL
ncbi:MAG: hypothetical protein R3C10_12280 [Pirellulales bacterium]